MVSNYTANNDRKSKGEESDTVSEVTHLQDLKLGGSSQKTLWQCCQPVVAEIPGE